MRIASTLVFVFALALAAGPVRGAEPKLTKELGNKVLAGKGKLTEAEVLKMVAGPVQASRAEPGYDADWKYTWMEVTSFEVEFVDGKVESATASFNDTVQSKTLTLDRFKQIKGGMTQADVEKLLGQPNSGRTLPGPDARQHTKSVWSEGRSLFVWIKDGKVSGGGFAEGQGIAQW